MRSWMTLVLLAVCGFCILIPSAQAGIQYTLVDLGTSTGRGMTWANDINDAGVVVGTGFTAAGLYQGFVWDGGMLHTLDLDPQSSSAGATCVNSIGQVVGWQEDALSGHGFLLDSDNSVTQWPTGQQAYGLNDRGDVVGNRLDPSKGSTVAYLRTHDGTLTDLPGLSAGSTIPTSINNSGRVVGYSYTSEVGRPHACLWENGIIRDLEGTPDGQSFAHAINNRDEIVGEGQLAADLPWHAILWANGQAVDLGTLGGSSGADDINDLGQVVGSSAMPDGQPHATLWQGGVPLDLNSLIALIPGVTLSYASAINNRGQIVGCADMNGQQHGFLLTPVPEPLTIGLVGIAILGLRRRGSF